MELHVQHQMLHATFYGVRVISGSPRTLFPLELGLGHGDIGRIFRCKISSKVRLKL